jgi:NADH pyrophosphatase NudC (nudix superfamily)
MKQSHEHPNSQEKLVRAYERMVERVKHAFEVTEEKARPTLERAMELARHKAVELDDITREEAEKISGYVNRDLREMAEHLNTSGEELSAWFRMDIELIEARILELITSVADKTRVELAQLAELAREASTYHTGEITAPGVLLCVQCGEPLQFSKTGHIPPCPKCRGTRFERSRADRAA